jgi:methionyl-tRNA formyltransferase
VAAYGQILSRDVLATARHGGINVHASLLPKYRGAAPINWAIYHGETQSGVSIIRMSTQLDAGDILAQEALAIHPDETAGELEARLGPLGARLAAAVIETIATGGVLGAVKQDKAQVTKAPKLVKENGLLDWTRPARAVCDQVRAMHPWPTAYAYLHRPGQEPQRLIVHRARVATDAPEAEATVGAVAADPAAGRLWVWAGDGGWVEILEVQPAGKRRMGAKDFLRGNPVAGGRLAGMDHRPE